MICHQQVAVFPPIARTPAPSPRALSGMTLGDTGLVPTLTTAVSPHDGTLRAQCSAGPSPTPHHVVSGRRDIPGYRDHVTNSRPNHQTVAGVSPQLAYRQAWRCAVTRSQGKLPTSIPLIDKSRAADSLFRRLKSCTVPLKQLRAGRRRQMLASRRSGTVPMAIRRISWRWTWPRVNLWFLIDRGIRYRVNLENRLCSGCRSTRWSDHGDRVT